MILGVYPLIGWEFGGIRTPLLEGKVDNTAQVLEWAYTAGLFECVEESSDLAKLAVFEPQLLFITASCGETFAFVVIKPTTGRSEMLRAILATISFSVVEIWEEISEAVVNKPRSIR